MIRCQYLTSPASMRQTWINYLAGLSGPQRKTINNVFNMVANPSPKQIKGGIKKVDGALTNTEMRMIITDSGAA